MNELISVIITTFNREELLERAIRSVIAQTYSAIELIVIDDCSNEQTAQLIEKIRPECEARFIHFIYERNEKNSGSNFSRNRGYALAHGFYVTGLDDDDYFLPERLSKLAARYEERYAFVTDAPARLDKKQRKNLNSQRKRIITLQDILCENVVGNQVLTTREKMLGVGGFSPEIKQQQDRDAWIKLILKYGPAIKYSFSTAMVDAEHSSDRITKKIKKYTSYRKLYFKYREHMSEATRSNNLFQLMSFRGFSSTRMNALLRGRKKDIKLRLKLFRRTLKELF
ncbi:glycosyltransferase [Cronobacter sakazakii]|uniref:glycosyltransferase n=1 Tax=Cronobacter sakazakii TaxID=28141 RepID=UPI000D705B88|nr:glycosyltransferase [Cronobacter sakazakii]ELY4221208.1 glycosyltransferase [Cronobacter sakazakii]MBR9957081.1 glycosyltransferase [Cronobacter sakazakii]PWV29004.1 family 2 glycosyl transferase [Cronobacter sakazakii]